MSMTTSYGHSASTIAAHPTSTTPTSTPPSTPVFTPASSSSASSSTDAQASPPKRSVTPVKPSIGPTLNGPIPIRSTSNSRTSAQQKWEHPLCSPTFFLVILAYTSTPTWFFVVFGTGWSFAISLGLWGILAKLIILHGWFLLCRSSHEPTANRFSPTVISDKKTPPQQPTDSLQGNAANKDTRTLWTRFKKRFWETLGKGLAQDILPQLRDLIESYHRYYGKQDERKDDVKICEEDYDEISRSLIELKIDMAEAVSEMKEDLARIMDALQKLRDDLGPIMERDL